MAEYRIVVDFNGGGDGYKSPNKKNDAKTEDTQNNQMSTLGDMVFSFAEIGANAFAGLATVASVLAIGKSIFSNEIARVQRYTGSQQAQDVANANLSILGIFANPLGATIQLGYERDQREYERRWESIGLQLARERGGVSLNRSRQTD